ncbi:hypothetical protein P43SY_008763 [Pythium insidiosum]|uniref:Reverse transcriptase Ty1/copia-type domain-containing protein n=1 Tax=Pythium insidiosum TaxID=114742 RepID=A0AAD5M4E3_PYTIN|nr:hypothetical protein P43SY_008763 [Pythium insidiosum]
MALDRMLNDEFVIPGDNDEPPSAQDDDEEEGEFSDDQIEAAFEQPVALADHEAREPAAMTEAARAIRSINNTKRTGRPEPHQGEVINELSRTAKRRSARRVGTDFLLLAEVIREPLNLAEARRSPQWHEWERATWVEIRALRDNDTYELVDLPRGARALDNTVQLRLKIAADGSIEKYKVRVCARGDKQVYLMDYVETRAPVVDLVCVKIFMTLAAKFNMHLLQGDVPAAYLKADLKETVYVKQVKGLKGQATRRYPRAPTSASTTCVSGTASCLSVSTWHNILVGHQDEAEAQRLMAALSAKYDVKCMGEPTSFLGMRVRRLDGEIRLSQKVYIEETLHLFAMEDCKLTKTPMAPKIRLDEIQGQRDEAEQEAMRHKPYRQVVGSLLYLARVSRPDIAFASKDLELVLKPTDDDFRVATDDDKRDRKSVSGYVAFLFGCPIHWGSTKQSVIALSSTTADFIAANDGLQQAEWIHVVLDEVLGTTRPELTLLVDNQSTSYRIKREGSSNAQKAIDVLFHTLKDAWQSRRMALEYVPTGENPADLLTKALEDSNKEEWSG